MGASGVELPRAVVPAGTSFHRKSHLVLVQGERDDARLNHARLNHARQENLVPGFGPKNMRQVLAGCEAKEQKGG